ncbi:uncharacterized protein BCR38DRAFT_415542 [Pseudomassariella vexata]|uniref:Uncharacterized protein n=1 Tax=Pseudomassariella vexata TaxID=1141098 RepID=A0A1Y2EHN0_9PEZI|nr:uncharacterized protein BCR38DRAFT_415542 [Pseudomassariella vexata]ORY70947.1 hypothetical protein BCR38DRAFT_415542 [Pseudomassariella vexata]
MNIHIYMSMHTYRRMLSEPHRRWKKASKPLSRPPSARAEFVQEDAALDIAHYMRCDHRYCNDSCHGELPCC